jgi:exopolysaccharide production protein ExoZ
MANHRNPTNSNKETVAGIQVLRAVAVLVVTICHAQFEASRIGDLPGAMPTATVAGLAGFGVQLFFIISGFVMVYATEPLFGTWRGPFVFLERRLVRIVPLYWVVTTFYLALTLVFAKFDKGYPASFVLASYLFIPAARPDGTIEPLVGQGWSLNYEMLFYAVFALTVFQSRRMSATVVTLVLFAAVAMGELLHPQLPFVVAVWTAPILLYFVFGIWIGLAYREGYSLTRVQGLALIGIGCVLLGVEFYWAPQSSLAGFAMWCVPPLFVAGASLPKFSLKGLFWSAVMVMGAASYALYLFHAVPIRTLFFFARWIGLDIGRAPLAYVCVSVMIAIALAIAIYYLVERPLLKALRWRGPAKSPRPKADGLDKSVITLAPDLPVRGVEERI